MMMWQMIHSEIEGLTQEGHRTMGEEEAMK
jgi:hypothetical protein